MALAAGHDWSHPMALNHSSADEVSSVFPDRPIRPLPKRKLRSRLSSEQAGSIAYPPTLSSSSPLFGSPQSQIGHTNPPLHVDSLDQPLNGHEGHICECGAEHDSDLDSEEEGGLRLRSYGYESFENTNNKKKRKIPVSTSGMAIPIDNTSSHNERLGVDSPTTSYPGASLPQHPSASGIGFSGAGRGRLAKQQSRPGQERRPLGNSSNAMNAYMNDDASMSKRDWNSAPSYDEKDEISHQGIISTAMADGAQRNPVLHSPDGQENLSAPQRQQHSPTRGKAFTFECKSTSSNKMGFPQRPSPNYSMHRGQISENSRGIAAPGTQTNSSNAAQSVAMTPKRSERTHLPVNQAGHTKQNSRKPRKPEQEYVAAARQRQIQQDLSNYHHPPRKEDIWICEFCEYEAIWGKPPLALVRQYEIKDHKERKAAEERRRLLEKAKAKGRKNKKSGRAPKASGSNTTAIHPEYDAHYENDTPHDHDSQGDEFFDDEYDDDGHVDGQHAQYDDHSYEADSNVSPSVVNGG